MRGIKFKFMFSNAGWWSQSHKKQGHLYSSRDLRPWGMHGYQVTQSATCPPRYFLIFSWYFAVCLSVGGGGYFVAFWVEVCCLGFAWISSDQKCHLLPNLQQLHVTCWICAGKTCTGFYEKGIKLCQCSCFLFVSLHVMKGQPTMLILISRVTHTWQLEVQWYLRSLTWCRQAHFASFPGSHSRQSDARDSTEISNFYCFVEFSVDKTMIFLNSGACESTEMIHWESLGWNGNLYCLP